ncbi:TPA: type IV secretion protein Dot [Legionella pneumophila]|uniref:type IV secretion protein Dot n=1 Tax=Legionella pneumophila TaxID=446 RepID=UPI001374AE3F|nr:type IV secretion protein Dot [Legionella pneumophila]HAT9117620.1 type IV secretion protein Dot [Legionella pneumophila subsp. pneumophila]HAT1874886.1 type IV secretion protein Dot [Legionella pneumophila]HAT2074197.1 type IV secretion protein Dot [Legionella pneumophila]HAT8326661.1 type IV secretion protein Dot [Legionella pneumophila]HAT8332005.1 type IV secretion protein Dot [Legionella pneumophila]
MQEKFINLGKGLKKVNEGIKKHISRAEEFLYLANQWEKENIKINDLLDGVQFTVNDKKMSGQEIKEELSNLIERYNNFLKKNLKGERSETLELKEIQQQLINLYNAVNDIYTYLSINKTEFFLEAIKSCYKKDQRMGSTIQFVLKIADHLSKERLQFNANLNSQFAEASESFQEVTTKFYREVATPRRECAEKLLELMNRFVDQYISQGASPEDAINKLKPFEKYFTIEIPYYVESERLVYKTKFNCNPALFDVNPIEFLNELFVQFYKDTTLSSRSKAALKKALDEFKITYEVPNTWYGYIGWDIPIVTDKNSVLVTYDKQAYYKYHQESGKREMEFFETIERCLDKSKDIIIATKKENLKVQKEFCKLIDKGIKELEETKKKRIFQKEPHELVTSIINKSIKLLQDLKNNMPLRREDLVMVILSTENALNAAKSKLKPQEINLSEPEKCINNFKKILAIKQKEELCFYKSDEEQSIFSKHINSELRELVESYQVQKISEKELVSEPEKNNSPQRIEPKEEDKKIDLNKKMNLYRVQKIMKNFVFEYCGYKGGKKVKEGGATIEELKNKLKDFTDYFQIEIVMNDKSGSEKLNIIFNYENIKNKNPHDLFNELFKKFTEDIGYSGMGSRSIEALKRALAKNNITYTDGYYGKTATLTSLLWSKEPPVITDEKNIFKLLDKKDLSEDKEDVLGKGIRNI